MVLLAVVPSENVECLVEKRRRVVLYLRRLNALVVSQATLIVCVVVLRVAQVV